MSQEIGLICNNCNNDTFCVLYDMHMGHDGKDTQFELLKCLNCGQLQNQKFETIR